MLSFHTNAHLTAFFFGKFLIPCAKCRTFDNFKSLEACGPYLSNETVYYKPSVFSEQNINTVFGLIKSAMSPDCFSNLLAFGCRTWFRECREVSTDSAVGSVMLPSLMVREAEVITPTKPQRQLTYSLLVQCRSECEKHAHIWEQCINEIGTNAEAKEVFNTIRQQAVCYCERFFRT